MIPTTEKNVKRIAELVLQNIEDENGRGEFDAETDLRSAVNTIIDWVEEEGDVEIEFEEESK